MITSRTERIARQFCDLSLPFEEWTHEAHLLVGLWHLLEDSAPTALDHLRTRIRAYNEASGVVNSDTSGYHETITRAYVTLIADFVESRDPARSVNDLAEELVGVLGAPDLLLDFYNKTTLMSVRARRSWVEPDRRALPHSW